MVHSLLQCTQSQLLVLYRSFGLGDLKTPEVDCRTAVLVGTHSRDSLSDFEEQRSTGWTAEGLV